MAWESCEEMREGRGSVLGEEKQREGKKGGGEREGDVPPLPVPLVLPRRSAFDVNDCVMSRIASRVAPAEA